MGAHEPQADVGLVGAQVQDGVVEFSRQAQGVPTVAQGLNARDVAGLLALGGPHRPSGAAALAVDVHLHMGVFDGIRVNLHRQGMQRDARGLCWPIAQGRQLQSSLFHFGSKHRWLGDVVHQAPVFGFLATHAFDAGAKHIGQIVANMALVGHAREPTGSRQHAEQGHLGQADR